MIIWQPDPVFTRLGPVTLRWYSLLFSGSFVIGYFLIYWFYRREGKSTRDLDLVFIYLVVGTLVCARLFHCLFYDPIYFAAHPLEIFMIWKGGLASHGTVTGMVLAVYLYTRSRPDQPFLWFLDRLSIVVALGAGFVRMGNLINSELVGRPTRVPWGFVFPSYDSLPRHPVPLYEALVYFATFVFLLIFYLRRGSQLRDGRILGWFFIWVFGFRFIIDFLKTPQASFASDWPIGVGQLLSVPLVAIGIWLLLRK